MAFVGYQIADGSMRLAGTTFFVSREIPELPGKTFAYAVTAAHVLKRISDKGLDTAFLRLNIVGSGATWFRTKIQDWQFNKSDPTIDVAVARFLIETGRMDHLCFPLEARLSDSVKQQHEIGVGDEVFMTGLFWPHHGKTQNIPIVRAGNIAAMPQEKISTEIGQMEAYLVEARSIGGLSGSPVFVHIGHGMRGNTLSSGGQRFFLMGLMHGHFDSKLPSQDATGDAASDALKAETVNMGIGIVVPIEK
ncbi:MAG: serine protease, partial [Acidobacteriota bacterium]|nr:serine protease [Acidobacteriota bacterium]